MKYAIRKTLEDYEVKTYLSDDDIPAGAIDCSLGVNPLGFTPTITKDVFASTFDGLNGYPSYPYLSLKEAICDYFSSEVTIKPEQVYLNNGSMSLLIQLNRLLINPGDRVLCVAPTFTSATSDMLAMGASIDWLPLDEGQNFKISIDALIRHLKPEHSLVYLDNPNNPTGQVIPLGDLEHLAQVAEAQNTLLIIDEAYGDFMQLSNSAAILTLKYPNVITIKTLSKGLGLAGLRGGYAVVPEAFIPYMDKLPAEMALNEVAARLAPYALKDKNFVEHSKRVIAENKETLLNNLKYLKYSITENTVPIVLIYTDQEIHLHKLLLKHGIITESGEGFDSLNGRHVRLRTPLEVDELLKRIQGVEQEIEKTI